MKRFLALIFALCLAVSMMTVTASAVFYSADPYHYVSKLPLYGWSYTDTSDFTVLVVGDVLAEGMQLAGGTVVLNGETLVPNASGIVILPEAAPVTGIDGDTIYLGYPPQPKAEPQPRTGVADTLPMWFGILTFCGAVYVLTSKKRYF